MINFKTQTPNELVNRLMLLQFLYTQHTPDECEELVKGTKTVEELFDEEGKPALFFNWEAMLFEIPLQELDYLASKLYEKKQKQEVVQGILAAQTQDEIDKQKVAGLLLASQGSPADKLEQSGLVAGPGLPTLVDQYGSVNAGGSTLTSSAVGRKTEDRELLNPEVQKPPMVIHMNNYPAKPVLPTEKK